MNQSSFQFVNQCPQFNNENQSAYSCTIIVTLGQGHFVHNSLSVEHKSVCPLGLRNCQRARKETLLCWCTVIGKCVCGNNDKAKDRKSALAYNELSKSKIMLLVCF